MRLLVLNCGSSSVKYRLFDAPGCRDRGENGVLATVLAGEVKGIGRQAELRVEASASKLEKRHYVKDHRQAVQWVFDRLIGKTIEAVGHRFVHGGKSFTESIRIDPEIFLELERLTELAPLHNPACLAGIRGAREHVGEKVPMIAVFDTAFHRSLPAAASTYAIPQEVAERHHIRRYGFHGIAHASLANRYAVDTGKPLEQARLITLQLGNGCSAAAIRNGQSIETSMGFTPLEGLVMGTRSGDLDPALVSYLVRREGMSAEAVEEMLNERSGLRGLSGLSHDMATLLQAEQKKHPGAALAIEVFCHRVRKYIGAYLAVLGGADAVIFGGGIGEHAPAIRARICHDMEWCGLSLDPIRNAAVSDLADGDMARISREDARLEAYVAAVDEETEIAKETIRCLFREEGKRSKASKVVGE
ncbi:MAG TPA: acetate kinase [Nitrospiraceae bacterium]|nr:acetate kinase [Nitrospiraceae bacterium]